MKREHKEVAGKALRNCKCVCNPAVSENPVPESGTSAAQGFSGIAFYMTFNSWQYESI